MPTMPPTKKTTTRCRTAPAAPTEAYITFVLPGHAAALLQIDERSIWRNVEVIKRRRIGALGSAYVIKLPVIDARHMLEDCIDYGNQAIGGEGADIEPATKYSCRRAAERIAHAFGEYAPRWVRS